MKKKSIKILGADPLIEPILRNGIDNIKKLDLLAIFERGCPNCNWKIPSYRLDNYLACDECIPENIAKKYYGEKPTNAQIRLGEILESNDELRGFRKAYYVERELEEFSKFFEELVGAPPWSAQRVWARRVLSNQSFAIIAPTGVGKTVFGIIMALYLAKKKDYRTYIVLPTKTLLNQVLSKIKEWEEKLGTNFVISYSSEMSVKERKQVKEKLQTGNFRILVTTSQFLIRNLSDIIKAFEAAGKGKGYRRYVDFMFVDDVDSFLRNVKNLDRAITLLGYNRSKQMKSILDKIKRAGGGENQIYMLNEDDWTEIINTRLRAGILVVSSATGRVKGVLIRRLFRLIFGFTIGSSREGIRNVTDTYDDSLTEIEVNRKILIDRAVKFVEKLGPGGLIFVARGSDSDEIINEVSRKLHEKGIRALGVSAEEGSEVVQAVLKFINEEVDVLIGKASPYGLLVRGLDLPEKIRYAIFIKIPQFSIRLDVKPHPVYISFILRKIANIFPDRIQLLDKVRELASHVIWLRSHEINAIESEANDLISSLGMEGAIKVAKERASKNNDHKSLTLLLTLELASKLKEVLAEKDLIDKLKKAGVPFEVREDEGGRIINLLSADVKTYIQASGRTSRLYAGGITKGLSIILPDNKQLLQELDRKLLWTVETSLTPLSDINLDDLIKEIDKDRERVRTARLGKMPAKEHLQTCLFIVESPTKARTIASFFGRPTRRILPGIVAYEIIIGKYLATIVATIGHITDLITHNFIPKFKFVRKNGHPEMVVREYTIKELSWPYGVAMVSVDSDIRFIPIFGPKVTCAKCGYVFIPYITVNTEMNDKAVDKKVKRIKSFLRRRISDLQLHLASVKHSPEIPLKCPRCGETEQLYDKKITIDTLRQLALESEIVLIGTDPDIEGEKIAWDTAILLKPFAKKIYRIEFHEVTRSAIEKALNEPRDINIDLVKGQFLRRIEDRWIGFYLSDELKELLGEKNLSAGRVQSPVLSWIVERYNLWKQKEKWTIINLGAGAEVRIPGEVKINKITVKEVKLEEKKIIPPPPLITDSLLRFSFAMYGYSADKTMKLAQTLFELGLITYIRTDSTRVSDAGLAVGKRLVLDNFGPEYHSPRRWGGGQEGAHECIRPTRPLMLDDLKEALDRGEIVLTEELPVEAFNVYDLIVRVFMASQMKEAIVDYATVKLDIEFERDGETETISEELAGIVKLKKAGFIRVLIGGLKKFFVPRTIPLFKEKTTLSPDEIKVDYVDLPKAWPLTEGEIVRIMRERGIGRPSTYATIIQKLFERRYIKRQGGFVMPKERGLIVNRIVNSLHPEMVSEERTRIVFERIDEVANRRREYLELLREIHDEIAREREAAPKKQLPEDVIRAIEKYRRNVEKRFG